MSIQQLSKFLSDQNEFRRQVRGCSIALFFQYDYSESQQEFKDRFPSSTLSALAGLKEWEWFINEKSQPNIRQSFYNQRLHIPMGPVIAPATRIEQCESKKPIAVIGFIYTLSLKELDALAQEQSLKGRQQFYIPVQVQSKSINGFDLKMMLATVFVDMANTGVSTNLKWVTAIKRMEHMPKWYVENIEAKLRGRHDIVEPFLIRLNPNPAIDLQAARRQEAPTPFARLKQQQEDQQGQQKQKKAPNRPMITISQRQRDLMLQQILNHGMTSAGEVQKLTESQMTLVVDTYLRRQQKAIYAREKAEKKRLEEASGVSAPRIGMPEQQWNAQAPGQINPREEAVFNGVLRKQKDAVRAQDLREKSSMPPPPQPVRAFSQNSPEKGQAQAQALARAQAQNRNNGTSPQLKYPQNLNNLKRPASNSISNATGNQGVKRQNTGNASGKEGGSQNSNRNNGNLKVQVSNPNAKNGPSDVQKPNSKTRGRPRKSRAKVPPTGDSNNLNQAGKNSQVAGNSMGSGGKGHSNANAKGNAVSGSKARAASGNVNQAGNLNGNLNTLSRPQLLSHVEQAAKMVDYFQPKASADKAGDGRLQ
ncbi:hypothetical protein H4I96_04247 [Botrytis cinerea]